MEREEMLSRIDHTQIKAYATWEDIRILCEEALRYHTASVCIPPAYVAQAHAEYGERLRICTVIGFPLGYQTTVTKVFETADAVKNGADEIDMVINIGRMKAGETDAVLEEIRAVRAACKAQVLKVIVETCYLTEEEKTALCRIVTEAGADYIKTSTGFGTAGATEEDVQLFAGQIGVGVKIKAAGGIRTVEALERFLALGCDRIGASATAEFAAALAAEPRG